MKSQRGITLTSLVLYIMLVLIVLGILSVITASFQSNLKEVNKEGTKNSEVDSFNMYFLQEVKKQGNKINTISENEILFTTGNKFSFRENVIYLNDNIKIAENIENCAFSDSLENGKTVITVIIKAKDAKERSIEYVLNSDEISSNYEDENNYISRREIHLPNGYKQVKYLESTGTQYILADYYIDSTDVLYCKFSVTNINDRSWIYCVNNNSGSGYPGICLSIHNGYFSGRFGNMNWFTSTCKADKDMIYNSIVSYKNFNINGVDYSIPDSLGESWEKMKNKLGIFCYNSEKVYYTSSSKLYSLQIKNSGQITLDLIPCLNENNVAGMYDIVNDVFYINQGTGDFITGPEI